jgi:hypothetical protein
MAKKRGKRQTLEEMLGTLGDAFENRLAPPLGGYAYRFTMFLPLLSDGKEVFSGEQRFRLTVLFRRCMKGCTEAASEANPPWYGSWVPPGTEEPVVDSHTLFVLYTPQIEAAKDFFRQLRWILERKHVANQDVILIEHSTVWLVEPSPLVGADEQS